MRTGKEGITDPKDLKKFMAKALPSTQAPPMNSANTFKVTSIPVMALMIPIGMTKMMARNRP